MWGQGFPEPRFAGRFGVESQRVVGELHAKLVLHRGPALQRDALRLAQPLPATITAVYRLDVNEYQGAESLQLTVEHAER